MAKPQVSSLVIAVASASLAWSVTLGAQIDDTPFKPVPTVIGGAACASCTISAVRHVRLGSKSGPGMVKDGPVSLAMDSQGRFITIGADGLPQLWSSSGQFLRSIGRIGAGPGEFDANARRVLVDASDSLWVLHGARISVFSPNGAFVRTFRCDLIPLGITLIGQGRLAVSGPATTRERAGLLLHFMNSTGSLQRSFALASPSAPGTPAVNLNPSQAMSDGGFWTREAGTNSMYRWNAAGKLVEGYRREAAWFVTRENRASTAKPLSLLLGNRWDASGRMWTSSRIPRSDWEVNTARPEGARQTGQPSTNQYDGLFDTQLELLDLSSKGVRAAARIPGYPGDFIGTGFFYTFHMESDGTSYIQIWRLSYRG